MPTCRYRNVPILYTNSQLSTPRLHTLSVSNHSLMATTIANPFVATHQLPLLLPSAANNTLQRSPVFSLKPFRRYGCTERVGIIQVLRASLSAAPPLSAKPDDLVASILSKVTQTDRGASLPKDGHAKVAEVATELQQFCVDEPVKCPLIFGEWDVVYCSNPTSPGGGYRSSIGRIFFQTKEMIQAIESPDVVRNKVSFSILGYLDGEVSLKGKLIVLDGKWIKVVFEPPQLKVGGLEFQYGGESEVQLEITYIDEKIRLGKGSRGSLFVFQRR